MINVKDTTKSCIRDLIKLNLKEILDIGCGGGNVSKHFENIPEVKIEGIDKMENRVDCKNFKFLMSDIRNFEFKKKYDLIICALVLHFLDKNEAEEIIMKIKKHTNKQGVNFFILISNKDSLSREKPNNFYPDLKKMNEIYNDWDIIKQLQDFTEEEDHGKGKHSHNLIYLIAKNKEGAKCYLNAINV